MKVRNINNKVKCPFRSSQKGSNLTLSGPHLTNSMSSRLEWVNIKVKHFLKRTLLVDQGLLWPQIFTMIQRVNSGTSGNGRRKGTILLHYHPPHPIHQYLAVLRVHIGIQQCAETDLATWSAGSMKWQYECHAKQAVRVHEPPCLKSGEHESAHLK